MVMEIPNGACSQNGGCGVWVAYPDARALGPRRVSSNSRLRFQIKLRLQNKAAECCKTTAKQIPLRARSKNAPAATILWKLGDLLGQVPEHRPARFVVHFGFEFMFILQRHRALRCWPRADFVD